MKTLKSRRLVIDTSVVCSASESGEGESAVCSQLLKSVLEICHRVVLTMDICDEWNEHRSNFSYKCRGYMQRRGKIIENIDPANVYINTSNLSDSDYEAVEKDRPLVEALLIK